MEKEYKGLSRRLFIKGAGMGAAGLMAGMTLAACAPDSNSEGGTGSVSASNTDGDLALCPSGESYPWPANPPEIAETDVEKEIDCDVVVVGLGVAGCAAFRSAAEAGAKTVAFEKAATPQCRSNQYAYINGPHSEAWDMPVRSDAELRQMGGLESNKEAQVLDLEREVIPGLYAAGNIQGNRFAVKYPFKLGGTSHCMAMFYGYVAGQNAAGGK